ncbi:MAG: T9SS type A sorting domain-containing protein [Bacteroidota bacterium]
MRALYLFIVSICLLTVNTSWAVTKQSTQNGDWNTGSTWLGGSIPSGSDNALVQHTLTSASALSFSGQTIDITGSLTINGNLILTNNSVLTVTGGHLTVNGTFEIAEGAKILLNGGTVLVTGNSFTNGAAGGFFDIQAGTMTVNGTTRITTVYSSFNNQGTFNSGALTVDGDGTTFINSGTVNITGMSTVNTVFTNTGSFKTTTDLIVNYAGKMSTSNPGTITVGRDMLVENGGGYTMNSGLTQITGHLNVNGGSKYTMTTGNTNVGGNMAVDSGGSFIMDGTTTVSGTFTNTNATATIGANSAASTIYANHSNLATNGMNNNATINGKGWLAWKGNFVNYIGYGGHIYTVPGPVVDGPSLPPTNPFSLSGLSISSLPIRLVAFQATQQDNRCVLTWATTQEVNFDSFVIEKSTDAKRFHEIGRVQGQGNSNSRRNYSFVDAENAYGISYYRLKSLDLDNSAEYSKVVSVQASGVEGFQMYPNPVENQLLKVIIGDNSGNSQIRLFNKMGKLVWQASLQPGLNQLELDTQLSPDVYYAVVTTAQELYSNQLVIK